MTIQTHTGEERTKRKDKRGKGKGIKGEEKEEVSAYSDTSLSRQFCSVSFHLFTDEKKR